MSNNTIGKAGELRVASELLLRGFIPMFSAVDDGADMVLSNGVRLQVKTARLGMQRSPGYTFSFHQHYLKDGKRKYRPHGLDVDFVVLWAVEADKFYVVPADMVRGRSSLRLTLDHSSFHKGFLPDYEGRWDLLRGQMEGG